LSSRFGPFRIFGTKRAFRRQLNCVFGAKRAEFGSPPGSAPRHPDVVAVFEPAEEREEVEGTEYGPPVPERSQSPADRRRAFEFPATRLDRPHRPADLLSTQAQPVGQARFLVRPRIDPPRSIVPLDPARKPNSKLALAVVDEDQPIIRHGPKLHCS